MIKKGKAGIQTSYRNVAILYLSLALAAVLLNTCFLNSSNHTINMFFLGPGYPQVPILNSIYHSLGWLPETLIMVLASCLGGYLLFCLQKQHYAGRPR